MVLLGVPILTGADALLMACQRSAESEINSIKGHKPLIYMFIFKNV